MDIPVAGRQPAFVSTDLIRVVTEAMPLAATLGVQAHTFSQPSIQKN